MLTRDLFAVANLVQVFLQRTEFAHSSVPAFEPQEDILNIHYDIN